LAKKTTFLDWYRDHPAARCPLSRRGWLITVVALIATLAWCEVTTSALQSQLLAGITSRLSWTITRASSASQVTFPSHGPFDERFGYTRIPKYRHLLEQFGFHVVEAARASTALVTLTRLGISPPFAEPDSAGFVIEGVGRQKLFTAPSEPVRFTSYEDIPPLVVHALSFIEDRRVDDLSAPRRNPAVDWVRFGKAVLVRGARTFGLPVRNEGGSTLAVQLEKYRHSDEGLTTSGLAKLQQIVAASLRAYQNGPDTREARRRIVLEYLNTIPLAAAPGFGEIHGLKDGLRVWFNADPQAVCDELEGHDFVAASADAHGTTEDRAWAFKHVLALLCSVRAPTGYLIQDHDALERRTNGYATLLEREGVLDPDFAARVRSVPLGFASVRRPPVRFAVAPDRKAPNMIRTEVLRMLGTRDFYELDRLHLYVESTLDVDLQNATTALFDSLADSRYVAAHGLVAPRMLENGDPAGVLYSLLLYESTPAGNLVRVHADNLEGALDLNRGVKVELGSTAKLRTLAHYLDVMGTLRDRFAGLPSDSLANLAIGASDPLTRWAAWTLSEHPDLGFEEFLEQSLERKYSASPGELFFTGGGIHEFHNFDPDDNHRILTIRQATVHSTNLVFIRLMRDLVRYHEAQLPYDAQAVLANVDDPLRRSMLEEVADDEARAVVNVAHRDFHDQDQDQIVHRILGPEPPLRRLAMLYFAWHPGASADSLAQWMTARTGEPSVAADIAPLMKRAFGGPRLTLADYGYLLDTHPLRLWCAGRLAADSGLSREQLLTESEPARRVVSAWLLETRHRGAQDRRLRTRIERDAFVHMAPAWRRLAFPFETLVPSYATAIGSSADRPTALADLMGIIVNDGMYQPARCLERLRFASETPYYTALAAAPESSQRVLPAAAARVLRGVLAQVVEQGTAQRIRGAFSENGDTLTIGGKTGSGDNRYLTRGGRPSSMSRVSRTAAFTFYLGDRYFGVITASVQGPRALQYGFTSSLPLAVLKLMAPAIDKRLDIATAANAVPASF
jgi:membrane peptidoglycan carboxypeptidase